MRILKKQKQIRDRFQPPLRRWRRGAPEFVKLWLNRRHFTVIVRELAIFTGLFLFVSVSAFAQSTTKIGLLIRDKNDLAIRQAAELAIHDANVRGAHKGQKFELVVRSCDGPWGIGSKQAVALIHEDGVPIVVGALDGRNAHLAEQVAAKSHVVMLSTLSSDPTLSRAYVPWYFRIIADDKQQAEVLAESIYLKNKAKKVAVIAFDNYDGKMSAETFMKTVAHKGYPEPEYITGSAKNEWLEKVNKSSWDAVVLAGTSKYTMGILSAIQSKETYAFLNLINFMGNFPSETFKKVQFVGAATTANPAWLTFENCYMEKYRIFPSPALAYVYDGISLACEAVRTFGDNPETIKKGFKDIKFDGITGKIEFDKFGNREMPLK